MSTPDPSDVPCPCQQRYDKAHVCDIPDYCPCDQRGKHSAGDLMSVYDFSTVLRIKVVPADSIVLDPEDEDVKALVRYVSHEPEVREIAFWTRVGDKIRAQITPPEHPPVAEVVNAVREWAQRFQPGDVWDPEDLRDLDSALWGTVEATPVRRTRKLENPREKPAKGPQSDAQGSGSGIGRVSESEASEGAPAHAEAWVGITISRKDRP